MMILKRIGIALALMILLYMALIIWLPKKAIWYEIESIMLSKQIVIDDETVADKLFSTEVSESSVYAGSLNVARIEALNMTLLGFYNRVSLSNLLVGSDLKIVQGLKIEEALLFYIPFMDVSLTAKGNFGTLVGSVDLASRSYVLDIKASAWLKKQYILMKKLKKTKEGYRFAGKF
jgi:hypothetical protein